MRKENQKELYMQEDSKETVELQGKREAHGARNYTILVPHTCDQLYIYILYGLGL